MKLDQIKVDDLHAPAGFLPSCPDLCVLRWIVCRKGVLDPKKPANRDTGQAIQFLAVGHKNSGFESVFSGIQKEFRSIQKYSEQFRTIQNNSDRI